MRYERREADLVTEVVDRLAALVAGDGGRLALRAYDPGRRALEVVLSDVAGEPCAVDGTLVADFLTEVLALHGVELGELRVDQTQW